MEPIEQKDGVWFTIIAFIHDVLWSGLLRLTSPRFRAHQTYVKLQNAHLDGTMHVLPDPTCSYCRARRGFQKGTGRG